MKKYKKVLAFLLCVAVFCGSYLTVIAVKNSNRSEVKNDYMVSENLAKDATLSANSGKLLTKFVTDNSKNTYWAGKRENAVLRLDFGKNVTFNTVIINEIGFNISNFSLRVSTDGVNFENVYHQERIETQRLCALREAVTARYLEFVVENSEATPKISDISVFNEDKRTEDRFDVVGYIVVNSIIDKFAEWNESGYDFTYDDIYKLFDGDKFNTYNVVNLISGVAWNENADLYYSFNIDKKEYTNDEKKVIFDEFIKSLREVIGDRDIRINITFGNPQDDDICAASMSGEKKNKLAVNMVQYLEENGFNGADIDWEYPITQAHFDSYNAFLVELKNEMNKANEDLEISLATSTWAYKYSPEAVEAIDKLQLMGYDILDQNGDHGGFYGSAVQAVEYCLSYGFKPEQINLGIGFYGTYQEGKMEQYGTSQIIEDYDWFKNIYTCEVGDHKIPNVYFNGGQMVYDKTAYAVYKKLSGVMTWNVYSDFKGNGENTLNYAIEKATNDRMEKSK